MDILASLAARKLITREQEADVRKQASQEERSPQDVLLELNLVDEKTLFQLKAEEMNMPLREVDPEQIPDDLFRVIPQESAKFYRMAALAKSGGKLEVGMVEPENQRAKDALQFLARQQEFSYETSLILPSALDAILARYGDQGDVKKAVEELSEEIAAEKTKGSQEEFARLAEEAPVTRMVAVILRNAVLSSASDVHIEPTAKDLRVRFRLLGDLEPALVLPKKAHAAVISRIKILSGMRIDETRIPQDGRFSTQVEGKTIDFRVSTLPTALGEKAAIRVLDPKTGLKSFEELGLWGSNLEKLKKASQGSYGLIFATGPTGSGKTTTLYAVLRELNTPDVNIVSLEDPVEYAIEGINQSQVRPDIGYDFAQGLRQLLRQDPDIIMVGEVRDEETASLVIHAALTGHIVLSTLHTNNAKGVVPRLVDMGIDRYLIPPTLSIALAQRLVRRLCEDCRVAADLKPALRKFLEEETAKFPKEARQEVNLGKVQVFAASGKECSKCGGTGYAGRIGIFEVLQMTSELAGIILENPSEHFIAKEAERQGMVTMRQDGIRKVLDGITTIEEVLRVTSENQ